MTDATKTPAETPAAPAAKVEPAKPSETKKANAKVNGTSKPVSKFTAETKADPAVDGVTALSGADEVAERSPDGSVSGKFTKAFILDRLDLDSEGNTPDGFDHAPNIDGTRHFGVQSGVRFTAPIKLISDEPSEAAPGTRVLTYGGKAVPAGTVDKDGNPVRDYYDPTVEDAGKPEETVKSNSAESKKSKTSTK